MDDLVAASGGAVTGAAPSYTFTETVNIRDTDRLTIPAGTTIELDEQTEWSHLVVWGTVIARGTATAPILITSSPARAANDGDFDRAVSVQNTASAGCVFEYLIAEHSDIGLAVFAENPLTFKNCTFRSCNRGVSASGLATFDNCLMENNAGTSRHHDGAGLYAHGNGVTTSSVHIKGCLFLHNDSGSSYGGGVYVNDDGVLISNSTFSNNSAAFGEDLFTSYNATIRGCELRDIYLFGGVARLLENRIHGDIAMNNGATPNIEDNTFLSGARAIEWDASSDPYMAGNTFERPYATPGIYRDEGTTWLTTPAAVDSLPGNGGSKPPTHVINASAGMGGTITPNGSVNVYHGSNMSFHVEADPDHALKTMRVDGALITPSPSSYTFTNVVSTHNIEVSFRGTGGGGDGDGNGGRTLLSRVFAMQTPGTRDITIHYTVVVTNPVSIGLSIDLEGSNTVANPTLSGNVTTGQPGENQAIWSAGDDLAKDLFKGVAFTVTASGETAQVARAFADVDTRDYLTHVSSSFGSPTPAPGTHTNAWGSTVWFSMPQSSLGNLGGLAFAGWSGSGSIPQRGRAWSTGGVEMRSLSSSIMWQLGYRLELWGLYLGEIDVIAQPAFMEGESVTLETEQTYYREREPSGTVTNEAGTMFGGIHYPKGSTWDTRDEYVFRYWEASPASLSNEFANATNAITTFTMPAQDAAVVPRYELTRSYVVYEPPPSPTTPTFSVTLQGDEYGTLSSSGTRFPVGATADVHVAMIPYTGCRITDVVVDGLSVGAVTNHSLMGITNSHSVEASFEPVHALTLQNVRIRQIEGTKQVGISYELASSSTNTASVTLLYGRDGVFIPAPTGTVSGDIGSGIHTGGLRQATWNAEADWNGQVADLSFLLCASSSDPVLEHAPNSVILHHGETSKTPFPVYSIDQYEVSELTYNKVVQSAESRGIASLFERLSGKGQTHPLTPGSELA